MQEGDVLWHTDTEALRDDLEYQGMGDTPNSFAAIELFRCSKLINVIMNTVLELIRVLMDRRLVDSGTRVYHHPLVYLSPREVP